MTIIHMIYVFSRVSKTAWKVESFDLFFIHTFTEIRYTKKVSVFPVGMLAKTGVSTPILNNEGKVVGFHDPWYGNRIFAVDMAGFAVNLQYFLSNPKATMPYKVGYEEDYFIRSLGTEISDLEPKAKNCTEVI